MKEYLKNGAGLEWAIAQSVADVLYTADKNHSEIYESVWFDVRSRMGKYNFGDPQFGFLGEFAIAFAECLNEE